jgi:hypothetical protein
MGRGFSTNEMRMNVYRLLEGKPERKIPLVSPIRRKVYNIKISLKEIR